MVDSLGFREAVVGLPDQMAAAVRSLTVTGPLPAHDDIANVLVLGTGAAGWVGDLLAAVAGPFMPVPLVVHKGFEPPSFVDASTLVVAISASGDSPEVVASATTATEAGGQLFAITSGGQLGRLADAFEAPTVFLPHAAADEPHVPPRARVGALAIPVLKAFDTMGMFPGGRGWIAAAIEQLRARRDQLGTPDDDVARVVREVAGTIPLVYGGGLLGGAAATRWKAGLNQTAKSPAFAGQLPDVVHGELAGWGQHGDITRQILSLVLLRHDEEPPEVVEQFDTVETWTDEVVSTIVSVRAAGEGALAQLLDLVYVGDLVALELAERSGIDPRAHAGHRHLASLGQLMPKLPDHLLDLAARVSNRGRWGADDQRGTLNLIDADAVRRGAAAVRQGRPFSLAIPFDADGPQTGAIPGRDNPRHEMTAVNVAYTGDIDGFCTNDDRFSMGVQAATHWDALSHVGYSGELYNGLPSDVVTEAGASKLGIEHFGPVTSRGILLDIARLFGVDHFDDGYPITGDDLDRALAATGLTVEQGDLVLVRTGHMHFLRIGEKDRYRMVCPGLSTQSIEWFHDNPVAGVATDTFVLECFPGEDPAALLPVHMIHLRDLGLAQGQLWHLDDLAADCAADSQFDFQLTATPIPLTGASGGLVAPTATK